MTKCLLIEIIGGVGNIVTAFCFWVGVHRMWSHHAFKAHWLVRLVLAVGFSGTLEGTIFDWCRGHRLHHKHSDTDGDPHNATRGLFYAHIGMTWSTEHPDVIRAESKYSYDDYWNDWVVRWQYRHYEKIQLMVNLSYAMIHYLILGDTLIESIGFTAVRIVSLIQSTSLINSAAHLFGYKPYNDKIYPTDNAIVSLATLGEGHHNYHHQFPSDYRQSESSMMGINFTAHLIDLLAWLGLVWDLKTAPSSMVELSKLKSETNNNCIVTKAMCG